MPKGWKTVIFGAGVALAPAFLTYIAGIDWTTLGVHPATAAIIGAAIIALRAVTTSAIGKA